MLSKVHRAVTAYLATAATPVSRAIEQMVSEGRWEDLVKFRIKPSDYNDAESYFIDAQAVAFFSKNADLPTGIDKSKAALTSWWEAEHRCCATNARLGRLLHGQFNDPVDLQLFDFLQRVKKRVTRWLGPVPNKLYGKFGPGVTLCCRGSLSTVPDKMSVTPTTTASLLPYLHWWGETAWARALDKRHLLYDECGSFKVDIRRYSSWISVRKNAKTDRSIEIGPSLNIFHQLFVGKTMKLRFRDAGWDLLHSADLHGRVARVASISGEFATIDLKQASDSVCKALVKLCLPHLWYQLLDDLRVGSCQLPDGRVVRLEKFSGMGNGYTFELESVLFMAISQEVCASLGLPATANSDVYVFGDDIIVRTEAARTLISCLRALGFETNDEKTFVEGPFKESCGQDFFNGVAVRPYFLEDDPCTPERLISFANGLRRSASGARGFDRAERLLRPWRLVLKDLPKEIRDCRGPEELGDIVVHDDLAFWTTRTRNSRRFVRCYRPIPPRLTTRQGGGKIGWQEFWEEVQLASRLISVGDDVGVTPRDAIAGYKLGWVQYS